MKLGELFPHVISMPSSMHFQDERIVNGSIRSRVPDLLSSLSIVHNTAGQAFVQDDCFSQMYKKHD